MDRRSFIKTSGRMAAGFGIAPLLPRLFAAPALAQSTPGYKAIVCLFLVGGNDGNNMLIPADDHYAEYAAGRAGLALRRSDLATLVPSSTGRVFGLHPALANVASLYNRGQAACLVNAGTLTAPITKKELLAGGSAPLNLLSHSSQQAEWQSAVTQSDSTSGWAGRIADVMSAKGWSSKIPTVISTAGWSLLGSGARTSAASTGVGSNTVSVLNALQALAPTIQRMESSPAANHLQSQIAEMQSGYIQTTTELLAIFKAGESLKTVFPNTSIGQQLKAVARMIAGRSPDGPARQIFYSADEGYDTHSQQLGTQSENLHGLDGAIASFAGAMKEIGMFDQVTLFTMTDFARSQVENGSGGSDHAWGNHHLIVGGAVKGAEIYGTFPSLSLGGDDDAGTTGLWIPTTSGSQYAATFARWLGVSPRDTASIFPELSNFSAPTLGFI